MTENIRSIFSMRNIYIVAAGEIKEAGASNNLIT